MKVEIVLCAEPTQIAIDPDQIIVDADPSNNFWHSGWVQPHFEAAPATWEEDHDASAKGSFDQVSDCYRDCC